MRSKRLGWGLFFTIASVPMFLYTRILLDRLNSMFYTGRSSGPLTVETYSLVCASAFLLIIGLFLVVLGFEPSFSRRE